MGHAVKDDEPYPGWVPGPNPFGNQRADDTKTWYRKDFGNLPNLADRQFEIRMNFYTGLWQINRAVPRPGVSDHRKRSVYWGEFRPATPTEFADPMGAMLWFELNKADL